MAKNTHSPLRYPGGKAGTFNWVSQLIADNKLNNGFYAEPYAGGAGLALSLLLNQKIKKLYLNDLDPSIWAFWYSILNHTDLFIDRIEKIEISIDEWHKQRDIQRNKNQANILDLGISTFFLNRTNRSGIIIKAGPIGGYNQNGNFKIDCRFNKKNLIERINNVAKYKDKIHLTNLDAIDFINFLGKETARKKGLINIDPPYYEKGSTLYTNFYQEDDHIKLAKEISQLKRSWIITYDNNSFISQLYKKYKQFNFSLNYSVEKKRKGTELLITSNNLTVSDNIIKNYFLT